LLHFCGRQTEKWVRPDFNNESVLESFVIWDINRKGDSEDENFMLHYYSMNDFNIEKCGDKSIQLYNPVSYFDSIDEFEVVGSSEYRKIAINRFYWHKGQENNFERIWNRKWIWNFECCIRDALETRCWMTNNWLIMTNNG
jgi:hypothetical protein